LALAERDDPVWQTGKEIFFERQTGAVLNQRVLIGREARVPEAYRGIAVLAPLDRSQPRDAKIGVRCATCHNHSPLHDPRPIVTPLAPAQRCDLCHFDHPVPAQPGQFRSLTEHIARERLDSLADCIRCHAEHPDFGPQAWSNSWLLPFDGNGDGATGIRMAMRRTTRPPGPSEQTPT
jgi:hypothetical protein